MTTIGRLRVAVVCAAMSLVVITAVFSDEPQATGVQKPRGSAAKATSLEADDDSRLTLNAARTRAKVMHDIYAATLEVLHHKYFHGDRATVPARAMQDIFKEIERQSKTEARWISASMKPMSISHEPKGKFEKRAATEIADGKDMVEGVEGGFYRRAGAIPLRDGCIGCHAGLFKAMGKKPQFAGLVISVPVRGGDAVELGEDALNRKEVDPTDVTEKRRREGTSRNDRRKS